MADKKKEAPKRSAAKKESALKKRYCLHVVYTEAHSDKIEFDELYEEAGLFDTKEKAEAFMKENPGLPQLRIRER
jgi:hypothetical protein